MTVSSMTDLHKNQVHALRSFYTDRIKAYSDSQVYEAWRIFTCGKQWGSYISCLNNMKIETRTSVEDNIVYNIRCELGDKVAAFSDRTLLTGFESFCLSGDFPDMNRFVDNWLSSEGIDDNSSGDTK